MQPSIRTFHTVVMVSNKKSYLQEADLFVNISVSLESLMGMGESFSSICQVGLCLAAWELTR